MKSCLSAGQVQIKDCCFPNGFILTRALTHSVRASTHTQKYDYSLQSLLGQEKIQL